MINLLPIDYRKELVQEYRIRLAVMAVSFVALAFGIGALFMLPSFFLLDSQEHILQGEQKNQEQLSLGSVNDIEKTLQLSDIRVSILGAKFTRSSVSGLIQTILQKKSAGITLSSFQYEYKQNGFDVLALKGVAQTRDELVLFKTALEGESRITQVQLPISDLAASTHIEFAMNLTLALTPGSQKLQK